MTLPTRTERIEAFFSACLSTESVNLSAGLNVFTTINCTFRVLVVTPRLSEKLHPLSTPLHGVGSRVSRFWRRRRRWCSFTNFTYESPARFARLPATARPPACAHSHAMFALKWEGAACQEKERERGRAIKCLVGMGWAPRDPER